MQTAIEAMLTGEKRNKAILQDEVIRAMFSATTHAVLHGGTTVWRCYGGKRFSKDIDIYVSKSGTVNRILNRLAINGLNPERDKQRRTKGFYTLRGHGADVSLQITSKRENGIITAYTNADGTLASVYALSPEKLVSEKIEAYEDRLDERDLYDMMTLTHAVANKNEIIGRLKEFLAGIKEPYNKGVLKDIVYEGIAPSFEEIVEYMRRWCGL